MSFMNIMDFVSKDHANVTDYLNLRILSDDGIETVPDMDINITSLNRGGKSRQNHFFNNGYGGITFKVSVLIKYAIDSQTKKVLIDKTDMWNKRPVKDVLHKWYVNMTPLAIVTDAIDVPNGQYIISANPARNQEKKDSTIWDLEFTSYTPLTLFRYKNDNKNVLKALKKNKAKASRKVNAKLAKCNYKILKYSKTKKTVPCVKLMQTILYRNKFLTKKQVDGWFGKETTKAVKRFQKKYNKIHVKTITKSGVNGGLIVNQGKLVTNTNNQNINLPTGTKLSTSSANGATVVKTSGINKILPVNGKVDKATFNALLKS